MAIALLLWLLEVAPLYSGTIVSFSIGWSIQGLFVLFRPRLEPHLGIPVTSALITLTGLLAGLLLAATFLYGDPLVLILEAPGTVILGVVCGLIGYQVVNTRERLLKSQLAVAELEQGRAEQARQLAVTELKVLQAQIEPHFLFNTLGNIQSLIHDEPEQADAMLSRLTTLLRGSFNNARSSTTTLAQELDLVRAYLEIQQIRMGDRLTFSISCDPLCGHFELPPLLIQPLVENAITHGIEAQTGPGTVDVCVGLANAHLEISIRDTGPGPETAPQRNGSSGSKNGHGSALANIRARLRNAYGERASLKLLALDPRGTRAQLRLPLHQARASELENTP